MRHLNTILAIVFIGVATYGLWMVGVPETPVEILVVLANVYIWMQVIAIATSVQEAKRVMADMEMQQQSFAAGLAAALNKDQDNGQVH